MLHGAWISGAALVAAAAAGGLALLPRFGYATPFGVPDQLSFRGRDYIQPACAKPHTRDLPLKMSGGP